MMILLEFKAYGKSIQYQAIDEAIRTVKFIRNSCIHLWIDNKGTGKYDLSKYCKILAKEFPFANELNSTARQAAAERAWSSISRFFENCKKKSLQKKVIPALKSTVGRLSTNSQDGSYLLIKNQLILVIRKELGN